jgi:hypothetical protein
MPSDGKQYGQQEFLIKLVRSIGQDKWTPSNRAELVWAVERGLEHDLISWKSQNGQTCHKYAVNLVANWLRKGLPDDLNLNSVEPLPCIPEDLITALRLGLSRNWTNADVVEQWAGHSA